MFLVSREYVMLSLCECLYLLWRARARACVCVCVCVVYWKFVMLWRVLHPHFIRGGSLEEVVGFKVNFQM